MTTRAIAPRETQVQSDQLVFAALPEVREMAKSELSLELHLPSLLAGEVAYSYTDTCSSNELRSDGPFAQACCREADGGTYWVTFRDGSTVSNRYFGGGGHQCRMYDGNSNCAGPNNGLGLPVCDYGPCGSTAAQLSTASYVRRFQWLDNGPYCAGSEDGPDWNSGGLSGSCPYRTCDYGTPVTGGDGHGWFDAD